MAFILYVRIVTKSFSTHITVAVSHPYVYLHVFKSNDPGIEIENDQVKYTRAILTYIGRKRIKEREKVKNE